MTNKQCAKGSKEKDPKSKPRTGTTAEQMFGKALGELILAEGIRRAGPDAERHQVLEATHQAVRELEEVIKGLDDSIRRMFPINIPPITERSVKEIIDGIDPEECGFSGKECRKRLDFKLIPTAFARSEGNLEGAAKLLKVSTDDLLSSMEYYGMESLQGSRDIQSDVEGWLDQKRAHRVLRHNLVSAALDKSGGDVSEAAKLLGESESLFRMSLEVLSIKPDWYKTGLRSGC